MQGLLVFLVGLAVASATPVIERMIDTVPELDVPKYLGVWYQAYGNRLGWLTYGSEAVCITATYGVVDESTLSVLNQNRLETGDGEYRSIGGFAFTTDEPGKLLVQLDGVPFEADYWIVKLGPATFGEEGLYEYAVVSNAEALALFVLTRDTQTFKERYEQEVLEFLAEEGFTDFLTRPIPTYHGPDCIYTPSA